MSRVVQIRGLGADADLSDDRFPLAIGGPDAAIPIEGSTEALAYLGDFQGHIFIQVVQQHTAVWHRHERLNESAWLKSGDRVQIDNTLLVWTVRGDQLCIDLSHADHAPTEPAPAGTDAAPLYEPQLTAASPATAPRRTPWALIIASLCVLLFGVLYVLLAASFTVTITPTPDSVSTSGFPPPVSLGGHSMALAGDYRLSAEKAGYIPLNESISIRPGEKNAFAFKMQKQPGTLTLDVTPQTLDLRIDGKPVGSGPFRPLTLASGAHHLSLSAPGFLPHEADIEVIGMGQEQRFHFQLEPNSAPISLTTSPAGALVSENGRELGRTPLTLDLPAGNHRLTIRLDGYKPRAETVNVVAKQPLDLGEIKLERPDAQLSITSTPAGASVTLDGRLLGTTPLATAAPPDKALELSFSRAGYTPQKRRITLKPEEQRKLAITLKPEYGVVFIQAFPADAVLYIDGRKHGPANARLKLSTRAHRIEIRKRGYLSHKQTITPRLAASQTIHANLKPKGASPGKPKHTRGAAAARPPARGMILLEPGGRTITLGASRREQGRRANERQHPITLKRPFYLAAKEVSNAQFRAFKHSHNSGPGDLNADDRAVANVSWDDAARYMNWLSARDGLPAAFREEKGKMTLIRPINTGYRFPTEAEWAYAARFAKRETPDKFPWGSNSFPPFNPSGNYADSTAQGQLPTVLAQYTDGFASSAPPGSFRPNAAGFYDMGGNVAEWCLDYYSVSLSLSQKAETDPPGALSGRHHVVRGSSWKDASITELRLSYRNYSDKPRDDLGFRIARYAE